MKNKRIISVLLVLVLIPALTSTVFSQTKKPYIPMVSKGFQHQFWQAVRQGAEKAAKDFNVEISYEGPETEAMVDKQMDMLAAALAKKPAALCYAALDTKSPIPYLQKAKNAGVPIITFDSNVDSDLPLTFCATDNLAAAAVAADKMAELIGGAGEIALVVHDQTSSTGQQRRDGFVSRIKANYPKIKIVDIQYGGGDHLKSAEIAKTIIQAHPAIKGIFGANEGSAIGVLNGIKELKKVGKIVVIGWDSSAREKAAIRSGEMAGAITQDPFGMGYKAIEAAVKAMKGEKLPKYIDTGFYFYDKTNMDDPKIAVCLYD